MSARRRVDFEAMLEDLTWMVLHGESWERAAFRLGVTPKTLERRLARAGLTEARVRAIAAGEVEVDPPSAA